MAQYDGGQTTDIYTKAQYDGSQTTLIFILRPDTTVAKILIFILRPNTTVAGLLIFVLSPNTMVARLLIFILRPKYDGSQTTDIYTKKVQVGNDQEKAQSEKRFPLQKPRRDKTKLTIRYLYHENIS